MCNKRRESTERLVALGAWQTDQLIMTRHYCPHANGKVRNCWFEYLKYIPLPAFMYPGKGLCLENSTALSQLPNAQTRGSQVHEAPLSASSGTGDCPVIHLKGLRESTQLDLQTPGSLSESHDWRGKHDSSKFSWVAIHTMALMSKDPRSLVLASTKSPCSLSSGPLSPHWVHRIYYCEDLEPQNRVHGGCVHSEQVSRSHPEAAQTWVQTPAV